ncbi:MAG: PTS mannose transporter subunit IIA [Bacillaceae bacterium]|nr:MAG: PTS mannose transporter subunit IIA [Bacillaceae bacterium]
METNSLFQVYFNSVFKTKEEVFSFLSEIEGNDFYKKREIINLLKEREKVGSTLIAEHVVMPHVQSSLINKSQIVFIHLKKPIKDWDYHSKNVRLVIGILLKENENVQIKKSIASFIRALASEDFVSRLLHSREKEDFTKKILKPLEE